MILECNGYFTEMRQPQLRMRLSNETKEQPIIILVNLSLALTNIMDSLVKMKRIFIFYLVLSQYIGCDYEIDSDAIEDQCGVCHGNGSTCETVRKTFEDSEGLGL